MLEQFFCKMSLNANLIFKRQSQTIRCVIQLLYCTCAITYRQHEPTLGCSFVKQEEQRACHAAMSCEPSSSRTVTGFLPSVLSCPGHDMCTLPNPSSGPPAGAPGSPHWPAAAQLARACHFEMANCILSGFLCSRL